MRILILIGAHLCTAPRPFKEAETLADAGHDVTIGGFWFDPKLVERDRILINNKKWRFQPIIDFQPTTFLGRWKNSLIRLKARIARERWQRWRTFSPELLGYGAKAMLTFAIKTRADLTIVHSEAGLWVGNQLLDQGFRVGVDFEDWFSEDLLPADRVTRPITQITALESRLARECKYCITTSHALAEALSKDYQAPKPSVIYNVFPWEERQQIDSQKLDRRNHIPSLHWFSQTIGAGRGLETLFQALPYLNIPVEIHLRGNYPEIYRQWLEGLVNDEWRDRIFIHPTVPNAELLSRIAEHDIGLALESSDIKSRDLTVTNKLFQYLQAGLAVIATDTAGQKEIFDQFPDIGELIPSNNPQALAQAIDNLLSNPNKLTAAKSAALQATASRFCWEKQAQTLVEAVNFAIDRSFTG
ncbi:MAG: glycosyltransferase [Crinalium sp.]